MFSFRKEQRQGDANNLVLIRIREGMSEHDAQDSVVAMHDALVERFSAESAALEREGGAALLFHVEACRRWLVGAVDWQRRSRRYVET